MSHAGKDTALIFFRKEPKSVIGVDISKETISAAEKKYPQDNITFIESDAATITLDENSVDVVVSFETIEHLEDHNAFFREIKRVLKKDGIAFISSPNKYIFSAINGMTNKFHLSEITLDEFEVLTNRWFKNVRILKQQVFGASHLTGGIRTECPVYFEKNEYNEILQYHEIENPLYAFAVMTDDELPEIPDSFYLDTINKHNGIHYYLMDLSIYANVIRDLNQQLFTRAQEHETLLAEKDAKLKQAREDYEALLDDRNQLALQNDAAVAQLRHEHEAVMDRKDAQLDQSRKAHEAVIAQKDAQMDQSRKAHEAVIAQKDAQMDQARKEHEAVIAQKDAQMDQARKEHEAAIARKDAQLEQARKAYETLMKDRDQLALQNDTAVAKLHQTYKEVLTQKNTELISARRNYEKSMHHLISVPSRSLFKKIVHRLNPRLWVAIWKDKSLLAASNMFDKDYYITHYPDVKISRVNPIVHYLEHGWREFRDPSPGFSTRQYLINHPDVAASGVNPLVHFLRYGQREGRLLFDDHSAMQLPGSNDKPEPTSLNCDVPQGDQTTKLANLPISSAPEEEVKAVRSSILFNEQYYRTTYSDISSSNMDMARHYCEHGWREGRNPSALFDTLYYLETNSDIRNAEINPLYHYITAGKDEGRFPSQIHNSDYEDDCRFGDIVTDIKPIAFYLPQFHEIPENNKWWRKGFTEWTNTRKAKPSIHGHYQPREPHDDIGYYDLSDWRVLKQQADMAKAHGIYGFCFYHYWFAGKRLLEKPVDMFLDHPEIDFPFCLCWANENWTRCWDGCNDDILIKQNHSEADDIAFIDDMKRYLEDKRYIRIDGKPVILLYRPAILPSAKETTDRWRERLRQKGVGEVYLICAYRVFADTTTPGEYGFDAGYEFAPNVHMPHQTYLQAVSSDDFTGNLCSYRQFVKDVLHNRELEKNKNFDLFYSVMLEWDNTPRREQGGTIFAYYTSLIYRKWLDRTIEITRREHTEDKRFVFINAWNEWAEGTYLEPDRRYGYLSLNETSRALCNIKPGRKLPRVSIVVPNYNHARFLRSRLDTIFNQTYKNIEVILMDDCSSDNSREILDEYAARHPQITRREYNETNSGGVFRQWAKGIRAATGDLVWIAESDDFCDDNFLDTLVQCFEDEAVLLAYSNSQFVNENGTPMNEGGFESYLEGIDSTKWQASYIETAHNEVRSALGIINTIPNSSSVVFRRPDDMRLLDDEEWLSMSVAGDWVFYLHLIYGGKIAYDTRTANYFRRYEGSAAESTYKREVYYREVGIAGRTIASLYDVPMNILEQSRDNYLSFFRSVIGEDLNQFYEWYDFEAVLNARKKRRPAVMVSLFAFYPGGAEIIAIRLANEFRRQGMAVLLHSGKGMPRENRIRRMLRNDVPVLETDRTDEIRKAIREFGIEVLNSHHWHIQRYPISDPTVFADLPRHVATLHGMIEADGGGYDVTHDQLRIVDKSIDTWVYTADKNVEPLKSSGLYDEAPKRFVKIPNGMAPPEITPIPREEMGIPENAFVLCNVSRAIPEKGWVETIEAVKKARAISRKDIRLILVGNGVVYDEYSKIGVPDFVYMPGFDKRSVEYYAASDMGIMLSRFRSESFPLTITDCLFAGKPYIASDIGEIRNMLTTDEGMAGDVFKLADWSIPEDDVARKIADFAIDTEKYSQAKARVHAASRRYTIENVSRQYLDVFQAPPKMPSPAKTCLNYSDDQWFEIMKRSVKEPVIDGISMPGFPDADQQIAMVGSAFEASFREADAFTRQVKQFMVQHGTGLTPHSRILDFGTGWGRMYRFFLNTVLPENILGTDVDQKYIDLCTETIPGGRFEKNNVFPPISYKNDSFDAVVGYSVFSHLNKDVGLNWIEEFTRILKPGGILAMTTHSRTFIDFCDQLRKSGEKHTSEWHIRLAAKAFLNKEQAFRDYDSGAFLYVSGMDNPVRNADVYGDAILSKKYVEREWTKYLDLVDFIDDKTILPQALIVMRKPHKKIEENKNASDVKKLSFYETDVYRRYEDTKEPFFKKMDGFCPICEAKSTFVSNHKWLRDNYRCETCQSIPRQRYLQHTLHSLIPGWQNMRIHESSPCNDFIKRCVTGYTASQFYPGKKPGERVGAFTNENIEALTFSDNTFDIFLSQDVLEHVFNPEKAVREMLRVVKVGGYVMFTIPVFSAKKTLQRARLGEHGNVEYIEDAVYHGNPIDSDGSLAVWDYGQDFIDNLKNWATDSEVEVFNHPIPEMGIEGEFLDVFYVKKLQSDSK
jgi:ubiquinone/menaquinone biosynthesis C-methylase UbiE/glycosyltransferase involved in cell wall biosynthesis